MARQSSPKLVCQIIAENQFAAGLSFCQIAIVRGDELCGRDIVCGLHHPSSSVSFVSEEGNRGGMSMAAGSIEWFMFTKVQRNGQMKG